MRRFILILAFMLGCGTSSAAEHWFADDGDTLWHGKKRVHLLGVDAPQLSQTCLDAAGKIWPCGQYARDFIRRLIASGDVSCTIEGKDRYGNELGVCFVGSIDLGRDLVQHGYASTPSVDAGIGKLACPQGDVWPVVRRSPRLGIEGLICR